MNGALLPVGATLAAVALSCSGPTKPAMVEPCVDCGPGTWLQDGRCVGPAYTKRNLELSRHAVAEMKELVDAGCRCKSHSCLVDVDRELERIDNKYDSVETYVRSSETNLALEDLRHRYMDCRRESTGDLTAAQRTGVAVCDDLIAMYVNCKRLPQQARDAMLKSAEVWRRVYATGSRDQVEQLTEACRMAKQAATRAMEAVGCSQD